MGEIKKLCKKLIDDLRNSENNITKQDVVDLLLNRDNILNDLHKFSDDFIHELLAWYKQSEIKATSKKIEIALKVLQACRDASQSSNTIFPIDESDLAALERREQARLYNFRGAIFYTRKNHEAALTDYANAAQLDPTSPHYPGNRGIVYHSMRDYDDAERELRIAIALDPHSVSYHTYLASVFFEKKDYANAIIIYTKIINLEPHTATNYENRARVYRRLENYRAAMDDYISASRCLKNQLIGNPPPPFFSQSAIRSRINHIAEKITLCINMKNNEELKELMHQQELLIRLLRSERRADRDLRLVQTEQDGPHTNVGLASPLESTPPPLGPVATQTMQRTMKMLIPEENYRDCRGPQCRIV